MIGPGNRPWQERVALRREKQEAAKAITFTASTVALVATIAAATELGV